MCSLSALAQPVTDYREAADYLGQHLTPRQARGARHYLDQAFNIGPFISNTGVLSRYLKWRKEWKQLANAAAPRLISDLTHEQAWVRAGAAVLLGESDQGGPALRAQLAREQDPLARCSLEAALAQQGDHPVQRLRQIVQIERKQRAVRPFPRAQEILCIHLIAVGCNVHRPEAVEITSNFLGDDGAMGEDHGGADAYLRFDTGLMSQKEQRQLGFLTPRLVEERWRGYRYPQLRGLSLPQEQERINQKLRAAFWPPAQPPGYREVRHYKVGRLDRDYISVRYTGGGIAAGAGSHNRVGTALTLDLGTGETVTWKDLFLPESHWREQLERLARPLVEKSMGLPFPQDFAQKPLHFYLTPQKLVLFDVYPGQLPWDYPIPIEALREVSQPYGPIGL